MSDGGAPTPRRSFAVLWRLLGFSRPYLGTLGAAFVCMALLGVTTGAYAYLMGPALTFLLTGGTQGLGLAGRLFPSLATLDRAQAVWVFPLVLVVIGVLKGIGYLGQFYWAGLYGQKVVAELRRRYFRALCTLSPTRLPSQRVGDLLSRFSSDVAAVEQAAQYTVGSYLRDSLQILVLIGVALSLNWRIAAGALVVLPIAVLPAARLSRSVMKRTRVGLQKLGHMAADLGEALVGLRTIQAFEGQRAERDRFEAHAVVQQRAMIRAGWSRGAVPGLMEILAAGAIAATLSIAVSRSLLPPAELISVLASLILIYQPAKDLGRVTQFALNAQVAGERIFAVLDAEPSVRDAPDAAPMPPVRERITVEDVWFSYGERPALRGLSLELPVGKVVAVVGASGSGKSTLATLLLRFERPDRGSVRADGVDLDRYTAESVRTQLALVSQDALLFSATVAENIRMARPTASLEEVQRAAQVAQADGFIRALPKGYDTPIGERGVVLSGGQRQRLALARAVLADAPILVLDEATSNLDPESEREVKQALAVVMQGRTALVIAHRLTTIEGADRIYVLSEGRVVEQGTHAELVAREGAYARLWSLQSAGAHAA